MFSITQAKGFQMTFPNGACLSVQWGPVNYCQHYTIKSFNAPLDAANKGSSWESETAEIAIILGKQFITDHVLKNGDQVQGHLTVLEVANIISRLSLISKEELEDLVISHEVQN